MEFLQRQEIAPSTTVEHIDVAQLQSVEVSPDVQDAVPEPQLGVSEILTTTPTESTPQSVHHGAPTVIAQNIEATVITTRQNPTDDQLTELANQLIIEPSK